MEERVWFQSNAKSEMLYAVRASSKERAWTGFDAALIDTSGGFVESPPSVRHTVNMYIGAPVVATCRCDGPVRPRLQVPGDIDIVPLGCAAAWEDDGPTTMLKITISPWLMRTTADSMGLNADRITLSPELQIKDSMLEHIGWALKASLEAAEPFDRLYAESLGSALAVHLLRRYARTPHEIPERGLTPRQLRAVIDFVQEHLAANLALSELATVAGVSASHFKSLFRQSVGLPVHQYVIQQRVQYAASLLSRGKLKLSEVALQAGFADQSHMARSMRRVMGLTPASLLRRCK
jgi:AraC family transcriptional regulator